MRTIYAFVFAICLQVVALAQPKIDVEQFVAITAKSVRTETLSDRVAVFFSERDAGERTGAFLVITSPAKWATPYSQDEAVSLSQSKSTTGTWIMFAKPGKYKLIVIEFDPETGPAFSNAEITIAGSVVEPPPPPPPVGNFAEVTRASKENADRLNDPPTRSALKSAYSTVIPLMSSKTYDECRTLITAARFGVFNARKGASRDVNWESWKLAVDVELKKVVEVGETIRYTKAIEAVIAGL